MNLPMLKRDMTFLSTLINSSNKVCKKLEIVDRNVTKQNQLARFKILATNAKHQNINLIFSPVLFERHRKNISFFFMKLKTIFWNCEFVLVGRNGALAYLTEPITENESVVNALKGIQFSDPRVQDFFGGTLDELRLLEMFERGDLKMGLKNVVEEDEVSVFASPVNPFDSILSCLAGKTVCEFPTFYVSKSECFDRLCQGQINIGKMTQLNDCFESVEGAHHEQ